MRLLAAALLVLLSARLLPAQSLGEVAEKEKARRAGLKTKSRVVTEKDLQAAEGGTGGTLSVTGEPAAAAPAEEQASEKKEEARPSLDQIRKQRIEKSEAWAAEWERRMAAAKQRVTELKDKAKNCRLADRMYFFVYVWGCEDIEERLAQAEAELSDVERSRYDWDRR